LTKLFARHVVFTENESDEFFLAVKTMPEPLALAVGSGVLLTMFRAANLGDTFAQAIMAASTSDEERFAVGGKMCCSRRTRWFLLAWSLLPKWKWMRERFGKSKTELFDWAYDALNFLTVPIRNDLFGLEELQRLGKLGPS
jgi:hypothetical protein